MDENETEGKAEWERRTMQYKKIIFGGSVGVILQLLGYSFLDWQYYAAAIAIFVLADWATEHNDLTVESAS